MKTWWVRVSKIGLWGAALGLGGCSFIFVDAPPPRRAERVAPHSAVKCTTSKAAPVVDTIITGLEVVRTAVAAGASEGDYNGAPISRGADIGFGLGFTALFGASAIYGFVVTGNCKDQKGGPSDERAQEIPDNSVEPWQMPPPAAAAPSATAPVSAPPPPRVCTPGSTRKCVGAGACMGGQSCLGDGSAWLSCECAPEEEDGDAGASQAE
jgi:hypothetical protein